MYCEKCETVLPKKTKKNNKKKWKKRKERKKVMKTAEELTKISSVLGWKLPKRDTGLESEFRQWKPLCRLKKPGWQVRGTERGTRRDKINLSSAQSMLQHQQQMLADALPPSVFASHMSAQKATVAQRLGFRDLGALSRMWRRSV